MLRSGGTIVSIKLDATRPDQVPGQGLAGNPRTPRTQVYNVRSTSYYSGGLYGKGVHSMPLNSLLLILESNSRTAGE